MDFVCHIWSVLFYSEVYSVDKLILTMGIKRRFNGVYTILYDSLPQRMPNMLKGEHSRTSEKDVRQ